MRFPGTMTAILALGLAAPALAQDIREEPQSETRQAGETQESSQADQQQVAEACLQDMNEFAQRIGEDQFWLSGWGGGYATGMPPAGTAPAGGAGAVETDIVDDPAGVVDPRAQVEGIASPRHEIRVIYGAAQVLAHRGDQEGCEFLLTRMNEYYDVYSRTLEEAGIDPASVTSWRQEQLALAQPLAGSEGNASYRIDDITGTDVRNKQDERLGSVNDVILDPQTGSASHLIIARGGFLGMGADYYAVPWDEVAATPGLATIVIDRSEAEIEQAPSIDPDQFRMGEERDATEAFWNGGE